MTMAIPSATTGRVSALFWRKPSLALFLLLLGPLMWFGIVYLGSLLTLLWQSFTPSTISPCRSPRPDAGQSAGAV
jgi:putative spermidine/putrescine transport system permease protein